VETEKKVSVSDSSSESAPYLVACSPDPDHFATFSMIGWFQAGSSEWGFIGR